MSQINFFKTFFQYDTLVKVGERPLEKNAVEEKVAETLPGTVHEVKEGARPEPSRSDAAAAVVSTPAFPALKHRMLVLIDEPKQPAMADAEALFLDKILTAVGHSLSEADVLNLSYLPSRDARTVLAGKLTQHFITFGVPLIKLQLDLLLPPYTPKKVDGVWFLLVDALSVIESDRELKKRLWGALQQMFAIN